MISLTKTRRLAINCLTIGFLVGFVFGFFVQRGYRALYSPHLSTATSQDCLDAFVVLLERGNPKELRWICTPPGYNYFEIYMEDDNDAARFRAKCRGFAARIRDSRYRKWSRPRDGFDEFRFRFHEDVPSCTSILLEHTKEGWRVAGIGSG